VDKTASFVARNGPEFEARIKQNEQNNPKFNFLSKGDPYNAYYEFRVKEFQEGKGQAPAQNAAASEAAVSALTVKTAAVLIDEAKKKKQSELLKQVELPFVPKDPPAEFEFIADPPSISAIDL
jgi:splicing factor 3A subunit 1